MQLVREGDLFEGIYPIGRLGNKNDYVELKFIHNNNFSSALEQWNRRVKRINRNNFLGDIDLLKLLVDGEDYSRY